jgi:hypothetical protein
MLMSRWVRRRGSRSAEEGATADACAQLAEVDGDPVSRRWFARTVAVAVPAALVLGTEEDHADAARVPAWSTRGNSGTTPRSSFLGTTNKQPLVLRTANVEQARLTETGLLGIGTPTPSALLHAASKGHTPVRGDFHGATALPGVQGTTSSHASGAAGVLGRHASKGVGVYGVADGAGVGVHGRASGVGGTGVLGHSGGENGISVSGVNTGGGTGGSFTSDDGIGLFAHSDGGGFGIGLSASNNDGDAILAISNNGGSAVHAIAKGASAGGSFTSEGSHGLIGRAQALDTTEVYGVQGIADGMGTGGYFTSDSGIALYARSHAHADYGAYIVGNVFINGTLSKAGGSFRIDHPDDPAHRYLSHSFVESPDMMNVYNGNVVLDVDGRATVELPHYFAALNRDYRYQLTTIGAHAPVYVATEIENNTFEIAGGRAGLKVSWQVTGIRQDVWANAHRIPVESDKPARHQGTYLHPELHGQPASRREDA